MPVPLRRLRTLPLLLVAVLGWLIPSTHADPGPDNPSEEDISAAYTAVESTAARVGRLEAELARANGELEALRVDAAKAVEAYNGADVRTRRRELAEVEAELGHLIERGHDLDPRRVHGHRHLPHPRRAQTPRTNTPHGGASDQTVVGCGDEARHRHRRRAVRVRGARNSRGREGRHAPLRMLTFLLVPTTDPERLPLGHAHRAPIDERPVTQRHAQKRHHASGPRSGAVWPARLPSRDWSRVRNGLDVRITSISVQSYSLGRRAGLARLVSIGDRRAVSTIAA